MICVSVIVRDNQHFKAIVRFEKFLGSSGCRLEGKSTDGAAAVFLVERARDLVDFEELVVACEIDAAASNEDPVASVGTD